MEVKLAKALASVSGSPVIRPVFQPTLLRLFDVAMRAIEKGAVVPASVEFEGRRYWMRVELSAYISVYADPLDESPLASMIGVGEHVHGHRPGH